MSRFRTSRRGLEAAKAELRARGIGYHEDDYGVAWSVYLPDPDGYQVEITTYEPAPASEATGSWAAARELDRRILVVWTVRDRSAHGVLAGGGVDSGPGWPGRTCPARRALARAARGRGPGWRLAAPRGPASLALQVAEDALERHQGRQRIHSAIRTSGSSTSTSPRGRSSGRSAWPG